MGEKVQEGSTGAEREAHVKATQDEMPAGVPRAESGLTDSDPGSGPGIFDRWGKRVADKPGLRGEGPESGAPAIEGGRPSESLSLNFD